MKEKAPLSPTWMATEKPLQPPVAKPDLGWLVGHHHTMSESVFVVQILRMQISFHPDKMLRRGQT